ncbi:MAG: serine hydrolase [Gammaproteobacteria bacterium]|nr:serine hydrolase [Gammaproteobacteria bacterium]
MKFTARLTLSLMFCVTTCTGAEPTAQQIDGLIAGIAAARVELDIPAVALTLVNPDRVLWSGAFGTADRASGRPADARTLFRIGSITKIFTALALLIAQEDGRLDLDARAAAIVPVFPMRNPWESTHPVRVADLLELTAGLPDMSRAEFDHNEPMTPRQALDWKAADRQAQWPPSLHLSYTNVAPGLAALVLEEATGMRYEDFVRERIFAPLGMDSAGFSGDADTLSRLATGYDSDGVKVIPYWHILYRASGAINVLPAQMGPFIQLLLNRGAHRGRQLISAAAIERMETPGATLAASTGLRFGYGLGNYTWLRRGVLFHGHGGDGDGFLARLGYSREQAMGYIVVINVFRSADLNRIRHLIEDFIAAESSARPPPPYSIAPERLDALAGSYEPVTWRFDGESAASRRGLLIEVDGAELKTRRGGAIRRLIPVNDNHFRYARDSVSTSAFIDYEGRLYFQDENGNYVKEQK